MQQVCVQVFNAHEARIYWARWMNVVWLAYISVCSLLCLWTATFHVSHFHHFMVFLVFDTLLRWPRYCELAVVIHHAAAIALSAILVHCPHLFNDPYVLNFGANCMMMLESDTCVRAGMALWMNFNKPGSFLPRGPLPSWLLTRFIGVVLPAFLSVYHAEWTGALLCLPVWIVNIYWTVKVFQGRRAAPMSTPSIYRKIA